MPQEAWCLELRGAVARLHRDDLQESALAAMPNFRGQRGIRTRLQGTTDDSLFSCSAALTESVRTGRPRSNQTLVFYVGWSR